MYTAVIMVQTLKSSSQSERLNRQNEHGYANMENLGMHQTRYMSTVVPLRLYMERHSWHTVVLWLRHRSPIRAVVDFDTNHGNCWWQRKVCV